MPKAEPHFDAEALVRRVHEMDIGLRVSTNDKANYKQIMYKAARKLGLKLHIYQCPRAPDSLLLMKSEPTGMEGVATDASHNSNG